jgi:uncharacterized protein (DUF885 family)
MLRTTDHALRSAGLAAGALLLATGCALTNSGPSESRVHALADRYIEEYFRSFPHAATFAGVPDAEHGRLPDISPTALAQWQATEDAILAGLDAIDPATLRAGSPEAITHAFLGEYVRNAVVFRTCRSELWNVSPTWTGWQSQLSSLANAQPVGTPAQNAAALQRFAQLPRFLDQEIANLREGLRLGYSAPRVNVRAVIRQMDALLSAPVAESPFVAMAGDTLPMFRAALERLETESIRPAVTRYRAFLSDEYLPVARDAVGVIAHPRGAECYAAAVRYYATVEMTADEVHATGLEEMARIRTQMQQIATRSFGSSDVGQVLNALRTEQRYLMGSRDEMMRVAEAAVRRAKLVLPQWFGRLPRAEVNVEPVPAFQEDGAPFAYYYQPAEDGSRPGIYYINLHQAETKPRAGLEATTFHEAYPGHHLQIALAMERQGLHPVQRHIFISGFGEGWALYTERLADEMGLYSGDVDRMGLLSNEALRAARLVVDAGMHTLGWTRDQAIDYMLANTAEAHSTVTAEVDRYIAVPGQATAYMIGALEIRRLRHEAQQTKGASFDIRAFHDRLLEDGALPLSMLRQKIRRWLEQPDYRAFPTPTQPPR